MREEEQDDETSRYRGFAPPTSYGRRAPPQEEEEEKLYISPPPPSPPLHIVQAPPPPPPPGPLPPAIPSPVSGEESYQRRVELSRQMQGETGEEAYQRRLAMSQQQMPQTQQATGNVQSNILDPSPPPPPPSDMEASRSAAAAIAARLSQKGSLAHTPTDNVASTSNDTEHRPDPAAFAERLMAKWGHTHGQGLGAEGNQGRSEAIVMEKVNTDPPRRPEHYHHQQQDTRIAARGKFNASDDPRTQADLERYGRPSEVIYLSNVLSPGDEVDPDLPEDIASECNKYGIVQRVALHPVRGGCFVKFSGPAGAWKAVRELDGRFFAGSRISARYYDRERFERGEMDLDTRT